MAALCLPLFLNQALCLDLVFEPEIVDIEQLKKEQKVGHSIGTPIVLEKVKNYNQFTFEVDNYLRDNFEGYKTISNSIIINAKGRLIRGFTLENDEKDIVYIYFDAEDFYRKYRKITDKGIQKRVKDLINL